MSRMGAVRSTGTVGSRRELEAARENAFEGGALVVHDTTIDD
jgi:hypothetical protein